MDPPDHSDQIQEKSSFWKFCLTELHSINCPFPIHDFDQQKPISKSQPNPKCSCKKSRCLKLYCQCFQANIYCNSSCQCVLCFNRPDMEKLRLQATTKILEKDPRAFTQQKKYLRCQCKKSACQKKYCECFQHQVLCGPSCRCIGCLNK